jgi:hypothetical protein
VSKGPPALHGQQVHPAAVASSCHGWTRVRRALRADPILDLTTGSLIFEHVGAAPHLNVVRIEGRRHEFVRLTACQAKLFGLLGQFHRSQYVRKVGRVRRSERESYRLARLVRARAEGGLSPRPSVLPSDVADAMAPWTSMLSSTNNAYRYTERRRRLCKTQKSANPRKLTDLCMLNRDGRIEPRCPERNPSARVGIRSLTSDVS